MEYLCDHLFDLVTSLIAVVAITLTFVFYKREKKEFCDRKIIETFINIESNKDIFLGSLKAFNISVEKLKKDDLSIEQMMYYEGVINTLWISNYCSNRRIRKINGVLKKRGYEKAYNDAVIENNKKSLIYPEGQTGKMLRSEDFQKAWKYLENYWRKESIERILIEVTMENNQTKK